MFTITKGNKAVAKIADTTDLVEFAKVRELPEIEKIVLGKEGRFDQWDHYPDGYHWGYDNDGRVFVITDWLRVVREVDEKSHEIYAQRFCFHQAEKGNKEITHTRLLPESGIFNLITSDVMDALVMLSYGKPAPFPVMDGDVVHTMTLSNRAEARNILYKFFIFSRGLNPIAARKRASIYTQSYESTPIAKAMVKLAKREGPAIDMWKDSDDGRDCHIFGYWNNHEDAYGKDRKDPVMTVKLDILENGNYPTDPTTREFNQWKDLCLEKKENFTLVAYSDFMDKLHEKRDEKRDEKRLAKTKKRVDKDKKKVAMKAAKSKRESVKALKKVAKDQNLAKKKRSADKKKAEKKKAAEEKKRLKAEEKAAKKKDKQDNK